MTWQKLNQTWHYVEKWAAARPDAEALVFGEDKLTWRQFKETMDAIAMAYLELGIEKGDRIALLSMARNEFLTTYMAAGKVGAIWLGLSPKFTLDELRYQLNDCRPALLITLREYMGNDLTDTVRTLMKECPFLKKVLVIGEPFEGTESFAAAMTKPRSHFAAPLEQRASEISETDEALLLYTSGSTGKPKGVVHTHRSIVENIKVEIEKFYFDENSRGILHFPINHVAADVEIGFGAIMSGGCIVCMDKFDPAETLQVIEKEKITHIGQVPVMFLLEFRQPEFWTCDFSSVKAFVWAGAAAPKIMLDLLAPICEKTGAMLLTGYGSTEVCGFITYTEKSDTMDTLLKTVGKIAQPFEIMIADRNRRELPVNEIGEISVRGPFLMKGYYNKPEETAKVIDQDGWYYTTDLGFKDSDGCIHIVGRLSEMFKTGGENVYPREVEEVIETHDAVLFAAVLGVPDELYQEVGWAFVMPKPGQDVTEEALRSLCKSTLANFKIPKKFFIRPMLPLLASGKVDKMALQAEVRDMHE
ncbi:MAG: AMP-binding protein [Deltaproteobacteria bacterium]|nr:AMP-binding protein [Deltaproteobacteria bacterium]